MNKKGITLFELVICLAIFSSLCLTVLLLAKGTIKNAKVERTINDLMNIATACQQYYEFNHSWPNEVSDLQPQYLSNNSLINVFGNSFEITNSSNLVTVSTLVPSDTLGNKSIGSQVVITDEGSNKRLSVSRPKPVGYTTRLVINNGS